jgi:hypothetical protein
MHIVESRSSPAVPQRQRPPKPPHVQARLREHPVGFPAPLRRLAKELLRRASDRGWFGLVQLRTHVVICGFPRSGTTLLLAMAESCYRPAKTYHREFFALRAAEQNWLGRYALMLTKKPDDIFWIDEVRAFYARRATTPRFVVMIRDPRAVLTSTHARHEGYYVSCERWQSIYEQFSYVRAFRDVLTIRYEDLVTSPAQVQTDFSDFIGWESSGTFEQFHEAVPEEFSSAPLNGIRPLDHQAVDKWRSVRHSERIRTVLRALPILPAALIELGYEADEEWARNYR